MRYQQIWSKVTNNKKNKQSYLIIRPKAVRIYVQQDRRFDRDENENQIPMLVIAVKLYSNVLNVRMYVSRATCNAHKP